MAICRPLSPLARSTTGGQDDYDKDDDDDDDDDEDDEEEEKEDNDNDSNYISTITTNPAEGKKCK